MMSLRDKEGPFYNTKQEIGDSNKPSSSTLPSSSNNSSRQWSSGFKNPRIVRVSRTFGGKDRHSKVCTIKGLRDRRIRLSVPTAIQLYDLQDRLGLSQPSKVIDWLIDNTKQDIDKLPPLPIIPGSFDPSQGYGGPMSSSYSPFIDASFLSSRKGGININSSVHDLDSVDDEDDQSSIVAKLKYWNTNSMMKSKEKNYDHGGSSSQVLAQNLFPIASTTSSNNNNSSSNNNNSTTMLPPQNPHPTYLSNNSMFNYYHLEPSNLSLTQLGSLGLPSSHDDHNQGSSQSTSTPQPSSLSLSSVPQLFLCPSMTSTSFFPQNHQSSFMNNVHNHNHQLDNEFRQFTRFPLSSTPYASNFHSSNGSDMKPFHLSMNHGPHLHQSEDESRQGKSSHSLWKESSRDN